VLPPPPLSAIPTRPSVDELRAFISLLVAEEPKLERRAAATNGSQGSQQRFEQQRCKGRAVGSSLLTHRSEGPSRRHRVCQRG